MTSPTSIENTHVIELERDAYKLIGTISLLLMGGRRRLRFELSCACDLNREPQTYARSPVAAYSLWLGILRALSDTAGLLQWIMTLHVAGRGSPASRQLAAWQSCGGCGRGLQQGREGRCAKKRGMVADSAPSGSSVAFR